MYYTQGRIPVYLLLLLHYAAGWRLPRLEMATEDWQFTDRLNHWVNLRRLSRRRLAERSDLDPAYVHRLITGERRNPSPPTVLKLALGLGLTADDTDILLEAAGFPPIDELTNSIF
jgi:transcriptional regulator with XRE-family HTH domain